MLIGAVYNHQYLFAQTIGKREDWLSKVVNGKIDPSEDDKQRIAVKLGVEDIEGLFFNQKIVSFKDRK